MKRTLVIFSILPILILTSCWNKDTIDKYYDIPDSMYSKIPYLKGDKFQMKHSGGQIINFTCDNVNSSYNRLEFCEWSCPDTLHYYQEFSYTLTPDYPIGQIYIRISALIDDIYISFSQGEFAIKTNHIPDSSFLDTLIINNKIYTNVQKVGIDCLPSAQLFADSLYYNFQKGVLGIVMSDGEKYMLYE